MKTKKIIPAFATKLFFCACMAFVSPLSLTHAQEASPRTTSSEFRLSSDDGYITTETNWRSGGMSLLAGRVSQSITFRIGSLAGVPRWIIQEPNIGMSYPTLYSPTDKARIISAGVLEFAGGGRGNSNGTEAPHMVISGTGNIGINTTSPQEKLHLANGSFRISSSMDNGQGTFNIRNGMRNDRFWLGTQSNHILTIGTNAKGMVNFFPEGYTVIYKGGGDADPLNISQSNRNKYSLFVMGGILSEDYAIGPKDSWADFVFKQGYRLAPLSEVETYITQNRRLPDMPSQQEVSREGYSLHEMNIKLLQKIEELTLHVIRQEKQIRRLEVIQGVSGTALAEE